MSRVQGIHYLTLLTLLTILGNLKFALTSNPCIPRDYNRGGTVCVCNSTYCDTAEGQDDPLPFGTYALYTSSKSGLRLNKTYGQFTTKFSTNDVECTGALFKINGSKIYQKMSGFGGAFTDAAGINILSLSESTQENLLRSYYSKEGIRYNIGRVPIGGSDFSTHPYAYDDKSPDPELINFNLTTEDFTLKIPIINRAQKIRGDRLLLFGSAWSAPPYMKTNNKITGFGFLKESYYDTWANYHIKFLDSYASYNISFWALTTGNEPTDGFLPLFVTFNSMGWTPYSHRKWIGQHLGPKLNQSYKEILIIAFDDQRYLLPWWMKWILDDKDANKYIDGIGVHWYTDFLTPISLLQKTHTDFPDKFLIYTEACEGSKPWSKGVILGSWERGEEYMHSIISTLNNWVTGWVDWNIALDLQGGPNWNKNFVDSPIIVNSTADEFYKQPIFYALAHFSKFIQPQAMKIDVQPQESGNVEVTAVYNNANSGHIVIIFHNRNNKGRDIVFEEVVMEACFKIHLPAKSFATLMFWTN